jgi:Flp pilus assembly protein TadG
MRYLNPKAPKFYRSRSGNVMVEFALAFSVLFSIFTGTFQFGYTFYQYNVLAAAVNDGARYASLRPYDSTSPTPSSAFLTAVRNIVVYGNPSGGVKAVTPDLKTSNVNCSATFTNGIPSAVTVSVSGYTIKSIFGGSTLTNKPKVTYAYQGIYSPY